MGDGGMLALYAGRWTLEIDETAVAVISTDATSCGANRSTARLRFAVRFQRRRSRGAGRAAQADRVGRAGTVESLTRDGQGGGAPGGSSRRNPTRSARGALARELAAPLKVGGWLTLSETASASATVAWSAVRLPDASARERRIVEGMNGYSHTCSPCPDARRFSFAVGLCVARAYDRSANFIAPTIARKSWAGSGAKTAPNPRSRLLYETPAYACYDVVLDVAQDFILHGYLLWPKGIREGERRPASWCSTDAAARRRP
jgi:hypothetical protein